VARGRISHFPIDLRRRHYNTLALPCECVIWNMANLTRVLSRHLLGGNFPPNLATSPPPSLLTFAPAADVRTSVHQLLLISLEGPDVLSPAQLHDVARIWHAQKPRGYNFRRDSLIVLVLFLSFSEQLLQVLLALLRAGFSGSANSTVLLKNHGN